MNHTIQDSAFDCPIERRGSLLIGPLRTPRQMLADQEYGGHASLHDDSMAESLGFKAGPIEGPTHFSQFVPLLAAIWGQQWFEQGTLSAHYRNMVVEGERVRVSVELPNGLAEGEAPEPGVLVAIRAEKEDGTEVLVGSASVGEPRTDEPPILEQRIATLRPADQLVILQDLEVGMRGAKRETVRMAPDQHMGNLYPFSLEQKLAKITESSSLYFDDGDSPWNRAIVPLEMVSVLAQYTSHDARFPVRGPAIGLFAGQQIRMVEGPLFVDQDYEIEREIIALSESRRTESYWVKSTVFDPGTDRVRAEMILNHATLKHSYEGYEEELARLTSA